MSGDYFYKDGYSTGDQSKCSLWILPITFGVKANKKLWCSQNGIHQMEAYGVISPRWNFACSRNNASYMNHHNYANGAGVMCGLGLSYLFKMMAVNLVLDFSYGKVSANCTKKNVKNPSTQIGGVLAGGGIGWRF